MISADKLGMVGTTLLIACTNEWRIIRRLAILRRVKGNAWKKNRTSKGVSVLTINRDAQATANKIFDSDFEGRIVKSICRIPQAGVAVGSTQLTQVLGSMNRIHAAQPRDLDESQ